jgi:phospholipase C
MDKINHLILLMMENRSFDHYFGALNLLPESRTDVNGLGPNSVSHAPIPTNPYLDGTPDDPGVVPWCLDPSGAIARRIAAGPAAALQPSPTPAVRFDFPDPPHEWPACRDQVNNGRMDGFVRAYQASHRVITVQNPGANALQGVPLQERVIELPHRIARAVMGYYTRYTLPVYYDIADQFTICDNWFASFLGSTHPNRVYANAGFCGDVLKTGAGNVFVHKPAPLWDAWEDTPGSGFTWRWYLPESEVLSTFLIWLGFYQAHDGRRRSFHRFVEDCRAGDLPSVSIVEPPYSFADDHPKHDPRRGQRFVAFVLKALLASPLWKSSALVIYYDEHGGFFDHVAPPMREVAAPLPLDRLGVRVPAMVVSPYARRGAVSHAQYDHRSVLKAIAERWKLGLEPVPYTDWQAINSLWEDCFDFGQAPLEASAVTLADVQTDWLARFNAAGNLPEQTDLVEAFVEMSHINNLDGMRALMEEDYYQL